MASPSNASIKALLDQVGNRIRIIKSTAFVIPLYYKLTGIPMITLHDLEFVTIGDAEFIKVRKWNAREKKHYYEYCSTEKIEYIVVAQDENDQLEPYLINL